MSRLFRGLRELPQARYDAVVIGAGIGGLVTANLLARDGLSVLLVERHYMVGGYCSTFRRGGFTFDAATHFYPLLGNAETMTGRLLAELGVETGWVKMDPVDTFHFPDGSRFAVPADFETYLARLRAEFPDQNEALDRFFSRVREAYGLGLLHYFRGKPLAQLPRLAELVPLTLGGVLEEMIPDRKLRLLLAADCPHWGSPPGRTSFVFDSMLRLSYFLGNYYPRGGSQAFADELARCLEARGGHVLTSADAKRILVKHGRATGVELELLRGPVSKLASSLIVHAETVISNADLLHTHDQLLQGVSLPAGTLEPSRTLRTSFPCWLTHLGVRDVDAAALEEAQGYYWDGWEMDRVGIDALRFKIFVPTLYEPAMAPPGKHVIILQKVLALDYDAVEDWPSHKHALETRLLGWLEDVLPGIGDKILTKTSATARTSWRFTGNLRGAMLGWEMSPDQLGDHRPAIETPIEGLYCVGHWTRPGGGITPVIVSAQQAARAVVGGRRAAGVAAHTPAHERPSLERRPPCTTR